MQQQQQLPAIQHAIQLIYDFVGIPRDTFIETTLPRFGLVLRPSSTSAHLPPPPPPSQIPRLDLPQTLRGWEMFGPLPPVHLYKQTWYEYPRFPELANPAEFPGVEHELRKMRVASTTNCRQRTVDAEQHNKRIRIISTTKLDWKRCLDKGEALPEDLLLTTDMLIIMGIPRPRSYLVLQTLCFHGYKTFGSLFTFKNEDDAIQHVNGDTFCGMILWDVVITYQNLATSKMGDLTSPVVSPFALSTRLVNKEEGEGTVYAILCTMPNGKRSQKLSDWIQRYSNVELSVYESRDDFRIRKRAGVKELPLMYFEGCNRWFTYAELYEKVIGRSLAEENAFIFSRPGGSRNYTWYRQREMAQVWPHNDSFFKEMAGRAYPMQSLPGESKGLHWKSTYVRSVLFSRPKPLFAKTLHVTACYLSSVIQRTGKESKAVEDILFEQDMRMSKQLHNMKRIITRYHDEALICTYYRATAHHGYPAAAAAAAGSGEGPQQQQPPPDRDDIAWMNSFPKFYLSTVGGVYAQERETVPHLHERWYSLEELLNHDKLMKLTDLFKRCIKTNQHSADRFPNHGGGGVLKWEYHCQYTGSH